MNIYKLISPVNKFNYVNIPIIKNNQDYNYQHESSTFLTRKLSVLTKGKKYSDKYLRPKINVIANFMQLEQKTIPAINKRAPEIVQNNSMYFSDPNTKYDELLTATPVMLSTVEPINYFGCRVVGDYLYNFDTGMIFKIIPKDFLARYIDSTLIKESSVYVDSRSTMIMPQKSAFKNIWMDTKRYIPINPKYVESIDINSLINQEQQHDISSIHIEPIREPVPYGSDSTVEQPIEPVPYGSNSTVEQPVERPLEQLVSRNVPFDEIPPLPFDQTPIELPVIESDNTVLEQQQQRKRKILDESLNQQQQPPRRRRKPKTNETK